MERKHPWKARLGCGIAMLILAFIGMITTDINAKGSWVYWKWIVPVYAFIALGLSWYIRRSKETYSPITLVHEILHWAAVIGAVFMISYYANIGTLSRYVEGLMDVTILALGIFLAGIYIESTFLFIGLVLGCFAILSTVFVEYLYAYMIPVLLGVALIISIMIWLSHQKGKRDS